MQQVRGADRLLVWDSVGEWTRSGQVLQTSSLEGLHETIVNDLRHGGTFQRGYCGQVSREHFATFCKLAWVWMRSHPGGVLVIEELADVTSPGKAPPAWGEIVRKHRHSQGRVYALTQRPAESDKTIVGNCAVIHAGRMNMARDRQYMAECLDIPLEQVTALADLEFIERDMRTRAISRGIVRFK